MSFGHPEHFFLTVWTPKSLGQYLLMMTILEDSACSVTPTIQTKQLLAQKANSVDMYMVYIISSVNFVSHFGHPKDYETFVWTPCFQILAKTMGGGGGGGYIDPSHQRFATLTLYDISFA